MELSRSTVAQTMSRSLLNLAGLLAVLVDRSWANTVYMDKYGDCSSGKPIKVNNEAVIVNAQGGEPYDSLRCQMTFKSVLDDRLCVMFRQMEIRRCDVKLYVFPQSSASGKALGMYSCDSSDQPETVCSEGKYLTLLREKGELSHADYNFQLEIRQYKQSDAFADGIDAYIVSISIIVGIIVGVIVLVVITAVIIVYCCCKNRDFHRQKSMSSAYRTGLTEVPVLEPSAPPLMLQLDQPPAYHDVPPPYTSSPTEHEVSSSQALESATCTGNTPDTGTGTPCTQDIGTGSQNTSNTEAAGDTDQAEVEMEHIAEEKPLVSEKSFQEV